MPKPLAVSCIRSFGDCLFSTPLTREVARRNPSGKTAVVVDHPYRDAYYNLPWIELITDNKESVEDMGYRVIDTSPCHYFEHYRNIIPGFSLIDVHQVKAEEFGVGRFDRRPVFIPTHEESLFAQQFVQGLERPLLALEAVYNSGQSWVKDDDIRRIVDHYGCRYSILWLSHTGRPDRSEVLDCRVYTRRQLITLLQYCDLFYNVGSGFFCASMAFPKLKARNVCMWIDDYYRYEKRFRELGLETEWAHNRAELDRSLN